jgi:carotenoid cleavage dioxygenase
MLKSSVLAPVEVQGSRWRYQLANAVTHRLTKALVTIDGSEAEPRSPYLQGNFAPVTSVGSVVDADELAVIEGAIPKDVEGSYLRVGPNPLYEPLGRYHWFDGDGVVTAVHVRDGRVRFANAWVETSRLAQERRAGYPLFANIGDYKGWAGLLHIGLNRLKRQWGVADPSQGVGSANTALVVHGERLFALHEADHPYALRFADSGAVQTVGRESFGTLNHSFTAHPKVDPEDGTMFFFGYSTETKPYVQYAWVDRFGRKNPASVVVDVPNPIMMHDFAITRRYAVFLDMPLVFRKEAMVQQNSLPFVFDKKLPSRVGILPKYATADDRVRWFVLPGGPYMCFHVANAWEEDDGNVLKLYACLLRDFSLEDFVGSEESLPNLAEVTLDLATGEAKVTFLPVGFGDFPTIDAARVGKRNRYVYLARMVPENDGATRSPGVGKVDLSTGKLVQSYDHGPGRFGGESSFVARGGASEEDDGYLCTIVWDDNLQRSEFVMVDARTMGTVARVALPQRVPHGFHGTWVQAGAGRS